MARLLMAARAALGLILLVWVLKAGGAWASLQDLFGFVWLVALLNAVPIAGAAIEAGRLRVLFGARQLPLPFVTGFRIVAIGTLFNLWAPGGTGGDVMKLYYISRRHRGHGIEAATILFVDRAVALFALLALVGGLLVGQSARLSPAVHGAAIGVAAALVLLILCTSALWSSRIRRLMESRRILMRLPLGRYLERAAAATYAFREHKPALLAAGLLSIAGHALLAATLALVGSALLPDVPPLLVATLALLGLVANALPITPGGIGVGEAAAEALFRSAGVEGGAGIVAAWRAGMIALSALGAAFYILGMRRRESRDVHSSNVRVANDV